MKVSCDLFAVAMYSSYADLGGARRVFLDHLDRLKKSWEGNGGGTCARDSDADTITFLSFNDLEVLRKKLALMESEKTTSVLIPTSEVNAGGYATLPFVEGSN